MSISKKYGRTYHYDFSPGTTSDDRINKMWWEDMQKLKRVIHTEKMDGENTCLNGIGVFARSHAAPTTHPWSSFLKQKFSMIQNDLKVNDIEIFGENMYAQHSIIYPILDEHFYVFAVRHLDRWLSWEEVKWYAEFFDYPVVPELPIHTIADEGITKEYMENFVTQISSDDSVFGSIQNGTFEDCTREGIVTRNIEEYHVDDFKQNVFKYVRKGHVSTDVHWSRNWKRASLVHELKGKNK
jgi:hypothetical protein